MKVKIEDIAPNPNNPRGQIYEWHVQELWESFGDDPISGITIRLDKEKETGKKYVVVTGDHRFEVARRRGDKELDVVLLNISKEEAFLRSLQENEVRLDNEPVSFGMALCKVKEANPKLTHVKLATMFGFKSRSSTIEIMAVKELSEEARKKIQEHNNNVIVRPVDQKNDRPVDQEKWITTQHITQIIRAPNIYHSQIVDRIITNESGELLTVKKTKELVEEILEKTKKLDEIQNYVVEGMNRVPPKYRARLLNKFEEEKTGPLAIKQMIAEFNGDIVPEGEHIEDAFLNILKTPYSEIGRYDTSMQFDQKIIELIKTNCEIPTEPKKAWAIEIRELLLSRKIDIAISKLFTALASKELSEKDHNFILQKTHQTIREFGLEVQVRNHVRQFTHYTKTNFLAIKDFLENPLHVIDIDEQRSIYIEVNYDKDLNQYELLGRWIVTN